MLGRDNISFEILFEKPNNKEEKDFVIATLSDRSGAGDCCLWNS